MLESCFCIIVIGIVAITNAGGLGGGGVIVPLMMGLYRFDTKNAVAISNFATPWSAVVRFLKNTDESHPLKNGKGILIDYNICTIMLPSAIVGASIGSIVNQMMPDPVILALFILATIAMVYQALKKYCHLLKSERNLEASKTDKNATKSSLDRIHPNFLRNQSPLSSSRSEDIESQEKEENDNGKSDETSNNQLCNCIINLENDKHHTEDVKRDMPLQSQKTSASKIPAELEDGDDLSERSPKFTTMADEKLNQAM